MRYISHTIDRETAKNRSGHSAPGAKLVPRITSGLSGSGTGSGSHKLRITRITLMVLSIPVRGVVRGDRLEQKLFTMPKKAKKFAKKLARKHSRKPNPKRDQARRQPHKLSGDRRSRLEGPLRNSPVEFICTGEYDPNDLLYMVKDSHDIGEKELLPDGETAQGEETVIEEEIEIVDGASGSDGDETDDLVSIDQETQGDDYDRAQTDSIVESEDLDTESNSTSVIEAQAGDSDEGPLDAPDLSNGPESDDLVYDETQAGDAIDREQSDFSESEPEYLSDQDPDHSEPIDFESMDIEQLRALQLDAEDGYDYDDMYFSGDDDADDMIQQLINGDPDLSRWEMRPPKKDKAPASKRQKARREARDAHRAANFGRDPEMWQKYPEVITISQVLTEIQTLAATQDMQEVRFPPLDNNANWYVKELGKLHGLKVGNSKTSPSSVILYRTKRAGPPLNTRKMHQLLNRRSNFRRVDVSRKETPKDKEKKRMVKPRDGDIVGHNAKEIESESFGHKLMTSMGWTQGTGLGLDRAGIVNPLVAKVKLTKRGIGS